MCLNDLMQRNKIRCVSVNRVMSRESRVNDVKTGMPLKKISKSQKSKNKRAKMLRKNKTKEPKNLTPPNFRKTHRIC